MLRHTENFAAPVVYDDKMLLAALVRTTEVRRIGCDWLAGSRTGQQTRKDAQRAQVGNDLIDTEGRNVYLLARHTHIGVTLIGANYDLTGSGNSEVATRHAGP